MLAKWRVKDWQQRCRYMRLRSYRNQTGLSAFYWLT